MVEKKAEIDKKNQLKWQVCFPPTGMQGWKIYEERMLLHERMHYSITMGKKIQ